MRNDNKTAIIKSNNELQAYIQKINQKLLEENPEFDEVVAINLDLQEAPGNEGIKKLKDIINNNNIDITIRECDGRGVMFSYVDLITDQNGKKSLESSNEIHSFK